MSIFRPEPRKTILSPHDIGNRSEVFFIHRCMECGYVVLKPFGEQRYDVVIEDANGRFWRIQIKTGRLRKDGECVEFSTSSAQRGSYARRTYTQSEIDFYGVYCRELGKCYLVPITDASNKQQFWLRLTSSPNENRKRKSYDYNWAADYEL